MTEIDTAWSRFHLSTEGPEAYQRFLVPAFFQACTTQLLALAAPRRGEAVLDVACGTGVVSIAAARKVGPDGMVTGIDTSDGMLAVARRVAAEAGVADRIVFEPTPVERLSASAAYDVICCQQGLQFFDDRAAALERMRAALRPGGRLALAMWRRPQYQPEFAALRQVFDEYVGEAAGAGFRTPFNGPEPTVLRSLLDGAGLDDVRMAIGFVPARFPSVADFLAYEALATPIAPVFLALPDTTRTRMAADLRDRLGHTVDDDGMTFVLNTWLVLARRS